MNSIHTQPVLAVGTLSDNGRFAPTAVSIINVWLVAETGEGCITATTIARATDATDEHDLVTFRLDDTIESVLGRLAASPSAVLRAMARG